jgi:1-acyl-sn-glycerol-3-phosphate acyltransferase
MALGALSADPDCGLTIIPCGMNYFHAHKFRSRAVVEFGTPVEVPTNLIELYKTGDRRAAVGKLLDDVYNALVSVTVTAPDYDTLMVSCRAFVHVKILIFEPADSSSPKTVQSKRQEASASNGC